MHEVILYSRPDCHLCDLAVDLLEQCGAPWRDVDIETDLVLIRKYGQCIPVLYHPDSARELFWPFGAQAVRDFVHDEK